MPDCPKCHQTTVDGAHYCHNCGRELGAQGLVITVVRVLLACFLGMWALGLGAFGCCAVVIGMSGRNDAGGAIGTGLAMLLGGALCVAGMIKLLRR